MLNRSRIGNAVLAHAIVIGSVIAAAQTGMLRYHWNKGETLRYRTTRENVFNLSAVSGLGDVSVTNTITQTHVFAVQDVGADGTATMSDKIESVRLDVETPMGTMSYDTATPAAASDPMIATVGKVMGSMVGEPITVVIAADGSIRKVDGAEKLMEKVKQSVPAGMPLAQLGGLETIVGEAAVRAGLGMIDLIEK